MGLSTSLGPVRGLREEEDEVEVRPRPWVGAVGVRMGMALETLVLGVRLPVLELEVVRYVLAETLFV